MFAPDELPSLVDAIVSSKSEGEMVRGLSAADARTFVDMLDEARSEFTRNR